MVRWLCTTETNCVDPSREDEFNDWYDNVHMPDVLEVPGVIRATRYENMAPVEGQGKFLALYEVETEDIGQTTILLAENLTRRQEQGRISELMQIVSGSAYRQISQPQERK